MTGRAVAVSSGDPGPPQGNAPNGDARTRPQFAVPALRCWATAAAGTATPSAISEALNSIDDGGLAKLFGLGLLDVSHERVDPQVSVCLVVQGTRLLVL